MLHLFYKRQGQMDTNRCYFYTDTIHEFKYLLEDDNLKIKIIESWQYLTEKKLIEIYAYVIMPNHIHLLWSVLNQNGKESTAGSFAKYTAHQFKKYLQLYNPQMLSKFRSNKSDRLYQFWKRDPLAILVDTEQTFLRKLEYIHLNPTIEKWNLVEIPEAYRWSSASFYETGHDEFGIITHYKGV